jgi:hypothetical protein
VGRERGRGRRVVRDRRVHRKPQQDRAVEVGLEAAAIPTPGRKLAGRTLIATDMPIASNMCLIGRAAHSQVLQRCTVRMTTAPCEGRVHSIGREWDTLCRAREWSESSAEHGRPRGKRCAGSAGRCVAPRH